MPDGFGGLSKCKVFDVSLGGETDRARSGEIVLLEGDAIGVASVGGVVLIRGMQVEGKRRMTVREYLAGNRLRLGTRLDGRP
jgi:methionyl-tRNA formyltransferase